MDNELHTRFKALLVRNLWDVDLEPLPWPRTVLIRTARILYVAGRDLLDGLPTLRAMSLVYTTLLALVPLLAVSFSVLKAFGVHNQIEPLLLQFLAPLGEKGTEVASRIVAFVENVRVGVLGTLGVALFIYTVVSLIKKVERAFNYIWHVTEHRSFARRFSDYLSVILVGPVLILGALGITASLASTTLAQRLVAAQPLGSLAHLVGQLLPYVLVVAGFAFIYILVPNTRVRPRSALAGGLVAGVLWETVGWAFASFVVNSTKYTAIYSGFAILILLMIWLYLSWLILLVGASIAFYHQHPEYVTPEKQDWKPSGPLKEKLGLLMMYLIGRRFHGDGRTWTLASLTERTGLPSEALESVLVCLERQQLLSRTADDPPFYLPARPLEKISVKNILDALRAPDEGLSPKKDLLSEGAVVEQLMQRMDEAVATALQDCTLRDLVLSVDQG